MVQTILRFAFKTSAAESKRKRDSRAHKAICDIHDIRQRRVEKFMIQFPQNYFRKIFSNHDSVCAIKTPVSFTLITLLNKHSSQLATPLNCHQLREGGVFF